MLSVPGEDAVRNRKSRRCLQRLVDGAEPLAGFHEPLHRRRIGVGIQFEGQPDVGETDRGFAVDAERAAPHRTRMWRFSPISRHCRLRSATGACETDMADPAARQGWARRHDHRATVATRAMHGNGPIPSAARSSPVKTPRTPGIARGRRIDPVDRGMAVRPSARRRRAIGRACSNRRQSTRARSGTAGPRAASARPICATRSSPSQYCAQTSAA